MIASGPVVVTVVTGTGWAFLALSLAFVFLAMGLIKHLQDHKRGRYGDDYGPVEQRTIRDEPRDYRRF